MSSGTTTLSPALTESEMSQLDSLESRIRNGIETFVDVGTALLEIRDLRLYRQTHDSFEAYCRDRWGFTKSRANQLISAAKVVVNLEMATDVARPKTESVARPLVSLAPPDQVAAWELAVEAAPDGDPTADQVKAVVARTNPARPPEPRDVERDEDSGDEPADDAIPATTGKSRINGVLRDDPPDIAEARAKGKIPRDAIPEIEEVDEEAATEDVAQPASESPDTAISDEEWLETLAIRGKIVPSRLKGFDADALDYRRCEAAVRAFRHATSRSLKSNGEWSRRVRRLLKTDHPKHWLICPATEHGGCAGTGEIPLIGACPKCHGRGYYIR